MKPATERLYFLDWVRILAFFLLIAYHVGMYYVSWDWHVKSAHANDALEPLMMLSSPWRLSLLFLVSGVASGYMATRMRAARFLRQRSVRLLVPLLFGMLVIVPPQPYFEVIEKLAYQGSYLDFMRLYFNGYNGFCRDGECLDLPTWNHLWFVAYLWAYTVVLAALMALAGERWQRLAQRCAACLQGWRLIVLPALALGLIRAAMLPHFETTHALVDDWYNHANYGALFILGALLSFTPHVWPRFNAMRWPALGIALACWGAMVVYYALPEAMIMHPDVAYWFTFMRGVYALCAWCAIVAACGFAHRHLNRDHRARAWLTEAVFPVYIVHQSLIVAMAHLMKPAQLQPAVEALMLALLTVTISYGVFAVVRRVALLRPLFGLATMPHAKSPPRQVANGLGA